MWTLLAKGGYAHVYVNTDHTEVKKVLPRFMEEDGQPCFNYSAIMDLGVQKSFGAKIRGIPEITKYEIDDTTITMYMPYYGVPINEIDKALLSKRELVVHIVARLCEILIALEQNGIFHTDLKPCNILYNVATYEVTLIDFNIISQYVCYRNKQTITPGYGTWAYSAPEVILYTRPSETSSAWVVGILMAYLYARYPWSGLYKLTNAQISSRSSWKQEILKLRNSNAEHFPLSVLHERMMPLEHVALYRRCTKWNPLDRPSLTDVYCQLLEISAPPHVARIHHPIEVDASISKDTRFISVTKLYNICRITKTLHIYLRAVSIFERSYTYTSPYTLFEHGCAAHCLALMMIGSYVFDCTDFISTIMRYWQLHEIHAVQNAMWWIANRCDWKLWEMTADVMLVLANPDQIVDYNEMKQIVIGYEHTSYDMNMIFKDMLKT